MPTTRKSVKRRSVKRRSVKHRSVKHRGKRGGGQGSGWEPGAPLLPGTQLPEQIHRPYDACVGAARPGAMAYSSTGGLAGMRGGRYTNVLTTPLGGFAEIQKVPCAANQRGGVSGQVYTVPNASYSQMGSAWRDSVGAPVLLNTPTNMAYLSKACVQTAGAKKRSKRSKSSKSRKSRKSRN